MKGKIVIFSLLVIISVVFLGCASKPSTTSNPNIKSNSNNYYPPQGGNAGTNVYRTQPRSNSGNSSNSTNFGSNSNSNNATAQMHYRDAERYKLEGDGRMKQYEQYMRSYSAAISKGDYKQAEIEKRYADNKKDDANISYRYADRSKALGDQAMGR